MAGPHLLLQVEERLKSNLSGQQIADILDHFLYAAINPIYRYSNYINNQVNDLLLVIVRDKRRKLIDSDREQAIGRLYHMLAVKRGKSGWKTFKKVRFQRHILSNMVEGFLKETTVINDEVARALNLDLNRLIPLRRWVEQCFEFYVEFKGMLIEKYIRYAYNESVKSAHGTTLDVDVEDLAENLIMSIDQAIGKYDSRRGTLTSTITWWFRNAKSNPDYDHVYGQSYRISSSHRKTMSERLEAGTHSEQSWSTSLDKIQDYVADERNVEMSMVHNDTIKFWTDLLNQAPDLKIARLHLEIPYKPEQTRQAIQ